MVAYLHLLFFEQTLCNYLSQLANVRKLFSIDKDIDKTYYSRVPEDLPGILDLMTSTTIERFNEKVAEVTMEFDPFIDRRNRFLDHLLSRFGEKFSTDFLLKVSSYVGVGQDDEDTNPEIELINAKIDFLQNYVDISKNRGKGFDYLGKTLDPWNVSGLEKRASLLLNIKQAGNESLLNTFDGKHDDDDDFDALNSYLEFIPKDTKEGFINLDSLYEIQSTFDLDEDELDDDLKDELERLRESLKDDDEDGEDKDGDEEEVNDEDNPDDDQ